MECPHCRAQAADGTAECPGCGLVFAKWRGPAAGLAPVIADRTPPTPRRLWYGLVPIVLAGAYLFIPGRMLWKIGIHKPYPADEFRISGLQRGEISLEDCRGRPVLLYLWSAEDEITVENQPMLERLKQKFADRTCFLVVSEDDAQSARSFLAEHPVSYPVYDGNTGIPESLWAMYPPLLTLIDGRGRVRRRFAPTPKDLSSIEDHVRRLLAENPSSPRGDMAAAADQDDRPYAPEMIAAAARQLLDARSFAELDQMAADFRSSKARTRNGEWKLKLFYEGLGGKDEDDEAAWLNRMASLERWRDARSDSTTARVALAEAWKNYAWKARGGGYANEITEDSIRLFEERLGKAHGILKELEGLPEQCPHRYAVLQNVALGQGWDREDYEKIFAKAVASERGYGSFYINKANYLLPRWGGEPGEHERFAEDAAAATAEFEGMGLYARIFWFDSGFGGMSGKDLFKNTGVSWSKMKQGFEDIEMKFPGSFWNLSHFAKFACLAEDRETAKALLTRIGGRYERKAWDSRGQFDDCVEWAGTLTIGEKLAGYLPRR